MPDAHRTYRPLAADFQAKGGFLKGIGKMLLIGLVILVLLGVSMGTRLAKRRR